MLSLRSVIEPNVILELRDGQLKAHDFVLHLSSKYFEQALNDRFLVSIVRYPKYTCAIIDVSCKERNLRVVDLTESPIRAGVIRDLVKMFYMHPFPNPSTADSNSEKMRLVLEMHNAAQHFAVDGVMDIAKGRFEDLVGKINQPAGAIELLSLVETMYDGEVTTQELRRVLLAKLTKFAWHIKCTKEDAFKDLLKRFPAFAVDFSLHLCGASLKLNWPVIPAGTGNDPSRTIANGLSYPIGSTGSITKRE